jgi:hypothetical protein
MNLNLNLDDKRIKKIVYQLEDGNPIEYTLNDGEINYAEIKDSKECGERNTTVNKDSLLYPTINQIDGAKEIIEMDKNGKLDEILKKKYGFTKKDEKPLSDKEMIDAVKKSEFMDELNAARKRFKIGKEIVKDFPEKDDVYIENPKRPEDKCSDESLKVAQEIIKMDKEGKLDKIAANSRPILDEKIKTMVKEVNNDLSYDSDVCADSIRKIENKVLIALRNGNKDELEKLIDNYKFYKEKKQIIDDKLWEETYKKADD